MSEFSDHENCNIEVEVTSKDDTILTFKGETITGKAGFSKSGKTCCVWYDDSSCDKYMLVEDGRWKIPGLEGVFEIEIL